MAESSEILQEVRRAAEERILFLPHAIRQMCRPERMISAPEVRDVVAGGEVIEDYPEDARGHSCLILGHGAGGRPIHVLCAPKTDFLAIITAYPPDPDAWSDDFRERKKR
jgi:hypothetical protein